MWTTQKSEIHISETNVVILVLQYFFMVNVCIREVLTCLEKKIKWSFVKIYHQKFCFHQAFFQDTNDYPYIYKFAFFIVTSVMSILGGLHDIGFVI